MTDNTDDARIKTVADETGKKKFSLAQHPEAQRIGFIFKRRVSTRWSEVEVRSLKALLPIDMEELELIEAYYGSEADKPESICRHDLKTLLNNWPGEVDRARKWERLKTRKRTSIL